MTAIDKFPLITKSVPGFLVNRVLDALHVRRHAAAGAGRGQGADRRSGAHVRHADGARSSWPTPSGSTCARTSAKILKFDADGFASSIGSSRPASSARRRARASTSGRTARPRSRAASLRQGGPGAAWARAGRADDRRGAARALDERVVESADLVDAGVIFGTGFAPFRGGPLHYKAAQGRIGACARGGGIVITSGSAEGAPAIARGVSMQRFLRRVAVVGGVRIPFCRSNTLLRRPLQSRHDDGRAQRARRPATTSRASTSTRSSAAPSSRTPRTSIWRARRCWARGSRRRRPASR